MQVVVQTLDHLARRILPFLTVAITLLFDLLPLTTLASDAVRPSLTIVAVYFWTLYRPDLLGSIVLFLLGLVADAVAGMPIGMTALMLLCIRAMVMVPQRIVLARSFLGGWLGLALVTLSVQFLRWFLACLYALHVFPIDTVLVSSVLTILCYPPVALLLGRANVEIDEKRHATGN
ncbi:rod shape-determining protein MreD [Arboricoccus pini]|uniref:Rod shape-determining protein MreD n=1 Tax=Arboricoccus pini TaxID=1963835 RepID=A0A212QPQ3_9PROT|nr:rod shape-determining protein MreD [Arboricoccus pini]SNB61415.1 rod shape-determining protein MreD [Arboricoccus pini]